MSSSVYLTAIKPPDETWRKNKAVYDACIDLDIAVPKEVWKYFEDRVPEETGVAVSLGSVLYPDHSAVENPPDGTPSVLINLKKLPAMTHYIKVSFTR